ncbi:MAG TPA: hypothetical protein DCZ10_03310 [Pelotomaculum sp.]|nr:hypothetical protein [Pelotomaculum sp.]
MSLKGYCCSQMILKVGLEAQNKENPDLIQAIAGLCRGPNGELVCGCLTAGVCLLSLYDPQNAAQFLTNDLVEWFKEEYGELYGGIDCKDILSGEPSNRYLRCPEIVAATVAKIVDMLEGLGYEFASNGR